MGVNPKIGENPPNHLLKNRVFHEINHPFWWENPLFLETPICPREAIMTSCCFFSRRKYEAKAI